MRHHYTLLSWLNYTKLVFMLVMFVFFYVQSKPKLKGFISKLKDCRVKYKDPSEKLNDKQFILVDDNGNVLHTHTHTHMEL